MSDPIVALNSNPTWWWVVGLAIVALLLLFLGRFASQARIAGETPPDKGPDLKATAQGGQDPDITPPDQKT